MSDAVRSLRIASTLADRFRALLRQGPMSTSDLELAIGEAQQLYPEIWRHLDEARTALIAMDRDVAAFDHLRMTELGHLGVTNIDSTTQLDYMALMLGRIRVQQVKTATFNTAGYHRAVAACQALMAAMPEIDWAEVARAEDREIAAAGSLHASKWSGAVKAIVIGAGLAGLAFVVYRVVTSTPAETLTAARTSAVDPLEEYVAMQRRAARDAQRMRILELRDKYDASCDRSVLTEVVREMRAAGNVTEAKHLETAPCTPLRPGCRAVRADLKARLALQLQLDVQTLQLQCDGVLVADQQRLVPALAITLERGDQVFRGVVSPDGKQDLAAFAPTPSGARLMALGDVDDDGGDELVFASERALFISRIAVGGFTDVAGPVLKAHCQADITVEKDYREGRKGEHKRLVLDVAPGAKKSCLASGRHFFALEGGALVETDR